MNKISNISFKLQHYYCDFLNLFWAIDIVDHKILLPIRSMQDTVT